MDDHSRDLFIASLGRNAAALLHPTNLQQAPYLDGLLEALVVGPAGGPARPTATGRIAAFQFKHSQASTKDKRFRLKRMHLEYYQRCTLPVLLVWERSSGDDGAMPEYVWAWAHDVWKRRFAIGGGDLSREIALPLREFRRWDERVVRDDILRFCRRVFPSHLLGDAMATLPMLHLQFAETVAGIVAMTQGPGAPAVDGADLADLIDRMTVHRVLGPGAVYGDRYVVNDEPIRSGSYGFVCKARDGWTGATVAVKVFNPDYLAHPGALLSLRNALAAGLRLKGSDVVVPTEPIRVDGTAVWTVMPWMSGGSILDRSLASRRPSVGAVVEVVEGLARILATAHGLTDDATGEPTPFIHRDLHPGNVLFERHDSWRPFLADWDLGYDSAAPAHRSATRALGFPFYRHPALFSDQPVRTPLLDVFGVCRIGRQLLLDVAGRANHRMEALQLESAEREVGVAHLGDLGTELRRVLRVFEKEAAGPGRGSSDLQLARRLQEAVADLLPDAWQVRLERERLAAAAAVQQAAAERARREETDRVVSLGLGTRQSDEDEEEDEEPDYLAPDAPFVYGPPEPERGPDEAQRYEASLPRIDKWRVEAYVQENPGGETRHLFDHFKIRWYEDGSGVDGRRNREFQNIIDSLVRRMEDGRYYKRT